MCDFKVKIHQIRSRLELHPRPRWGNLQRSPEVLLNLLLLFVLWCIVTVCFNFFAMSIPDTFALDVGKSDSSICVTIVVQTLAFWL